MTKTFKKVMTFLLGLTMLGGAVGGAVLANPAGGGLELKATEETITIAAADFGLGNGDAVSNANVKGIIFDGAKGTHTGSVPSYWTSDSTVRMYKGNTFTITSTIGNMTSITMTFERGGNYISISSGNASYSNPTITSSDAGGMESVSLSITDALRIESFEIVVTSQDITLDDLFVVGEESFTTFDVLTTDDFLLDGTKSDGTEVTLDDLTVQIGHDTELRDVEWGVTKPLVTDTVIRFTSTIPNSTGGYDTFDVNITVTEPTVASIAISGDMTTKSYIPGDSWDNSGLVVTGTFDVGGTTDLTNEVQWTYSPGAPALGVEQVIVTATYGNLTNSIVINNIVVENLVADTIDKSDVPQPTGDASYANWTPEGTAATYVVHSYTKQNYIQLRAESPSGIVSTISGGKIKSITIEWTASTAAGRNLSIYASNSPYSSPADLYSESVNAITALNKGNNETTYEFTEEYSYVGVRSASGSLYLDSITFVWQADVVTSLGSVEVVGTMNKTEYFTNEEWKADGLSVDLHYSDGAVSNITTGYTLTWDPATPVLGTKQVSVTATYNNVTSEPVTFNVTVEEYVEPVYSYHPTEDPTGFDTGSFTAEGLGWEFYMTGTEPVVSTFDDIKGLHFGTNSKPADTVALYSDIFAATTGETMINRIVVNASSAAGNDGAATMTIKVNNEVVNTVTLTSTATDYSTVLDTPVWGSVEIVLTNGGKKAAMYFGGIDIFAETDATVTASLVAAVNGLLDFRTCEISATHQEFGAWLDANRTTIEDNREVLANLVAHDYESMDITYIGNKTSIVNVLAKYDACVARYETANGALAPTIFGNEDTTIAVVVVIITLAAITALVGFYYYDKRRRVNK